VLLPGPLWSLSDLRKRNPEHMAVQYLEDRQFDCDYLTKRFDCSFVLDSEYAYASQRICAPLYMDGRLVNWQCRYVGDPPPRVPKWFTKPKTKKKFHIYNYDMMRRHRTKIIVEGPSDVWAQGPQAGGIIGKKLSRTQAQLIADACEPGDTVVLMLDPQLDDRERMRGKEHHIESAYSKLIAHKKLAGKVVRVYLPETMDPGSADRDFSRDYIRARAEEQKVRVWFAPPRKRERIKS
jgi:hypothetical protein